MSHVWKQFQDEIVHQRAFTKRASNFFLAPQGRFQDIIHILQKQNLLTKSMGFNNRNLSHKTLKDRALKKKKLFHMHDDKLDFNQHVWIQSIFSVLLYLAV